MGRKDKDHNKDTFQKVLRGLAQQTPSAAERRKDEQRQAQLKAESERMEADSRAINQRLEQERRAEIAHARAEKERREHKG